jgi:hypothetical protein
MTNASEGSRNHPESTLLRDAFGPYVELETDAGEETFHIKAEFYIGDVLYAALQSKAMVKEDELEFFRVVEEDGEFHLESIEDDEEWETAAEAYDDQFFASDERP